MYIREIFLYFLLGLSPPLDLTIQFSENLKDIRVHEPTSPNSFTNQVSYQKRSRAEKFGTSLTGDRDNRYGEVVLCRISLGHYRLHAATSIPLKVAKVTEIPHRVHQPVF